MNRYFQDWSIDGYTAKSPDGKYDLWIGNGFMSFNDHEPKQTLLAGVGLWYRYKLWRDLKRERKQRIKEFINRGKAPLKDTP